MDKFDIKYYAKIMFKVLIIAFIGLCLFGAFKLAVFYVPFLIAILISTMIEPLIKLFMKKCKLKRKTASIISLLIFAVIITVILVFLISSIIVESKALLDELNGPANNIYNWSMDFINNIKDGNITIPEEVLQAIQGALNGILESAKDILVGALSGIANFATSIPTAITYAVITILAIVFICLDRDYVFKMAKKHLPEQWLVKAREIVDKTWTISWNYIKAEAKLSGLCFIFVLVGLTLLDIFGFNVKYYVLMAIFIGFVDLIPLLGAGTVMIPWAIYLYFTGNIPLAIAVVVLWGVWTIIKQIIEPKFVSEQMGMHPIFTLLGMYTGFKLVGVVGLILGPIVFLIIKNVFNDLFERGIVKTFFELK